MPTSMFLSAPVPTHTANGVYHAISTLTISFVITILLVHSAFLKVIFLDLKLLFTVYTNRSVVDHYLGISAVQPRCFH